MNCDQARTEIIAYLRGELNEEQVRRLEEHLARCPACRHELEGARRLLSWTEAASQEATVKKIEEIIDNAIRAGASDIHMEPQQDNSLLVRYRIDGVLHQAHSIDSIYRHGTIARLKMMAEISVAETDLPQDGRIKWSLGDNHYDMRLSSMPTVFGEAVVIRLLEPSSGAIALESTGISEEDTAKLRRLLQQPSGMLLTSGPTGSGKTTVLFSLVSSLDADALKILTIEDPVEYVLPGVNQVNVNKRAGLTFSVAARAALRHDPDVIVIGEMPDWETASICTRAAITGHVVLSSLHTEDAVGAIQRMRDIGVEDVLIAASLLGATCQRLVRKICEECKQAVEVDPEDAVFSALGITVDDLRTHTISRGSGCEKCNHTGYWRRVPIFEILEIDRDLARLIGNGATATEILQAARQKGHRTLVEDGRQKVLQGITTPEEVFRVLSWSVLAPERAEHREA